MDAGSRRSGTGRGGYVRFVPGVAALLEYRRSWFKTDLAAGLSVAAVALPVGVAYADLAGVPPVFGIYSAIFPLFGYALFGSSRQLMVGPDAATCIMVAAILGPLAGGDPARYVALMVLLTLLVGVMYVLAGLGRLGFIASFLPLPILTGYLNGMALIIVAGQLPKLFGYESGAGSFIPQVVEFGGHAASFNGPTTLLAAGLVALLVALRRWAPRLPNPLIVVVLGMALTMGFELDSRGVSLLGTVPAGLPPGFTVPRLDLAALEDLLSNAAALVLVSFTSGILTARSFAERRGQDVDANRELIGFGAANLASALGHGFVVTGADSRTAVNDAMGGKTQVTGLVAAVTMLVVLLFFTQPLAWVPNAALAAVIVVSAVGLFDPKTLRELYAVSRVELAFSVGTTVAVLILGVLPGILLAVVLSILMLLSAASRPNVAVLGQVPGTATFHSVETHPEAESIPGLLLFRFDAAVVFFNADYFKSRVLEAVEQAAEPVLWVVVDSSPINLYDVTALRRFQQLRQELGRRGVLLCATEAKGRTARFFSAGWGRVRRERLAACVFPSLQAAVDAFVRRDSEATPRQHPSDSPVEASGD